MCQTRAQGGKRCAAHNRAGELTYQRARIDALNADLDDASYLARLAHAEAEELSAAAERNPADATAAHNARLAERDALEADHAAEEVHAALDSAFITAGLTDVKGHPEYGDQLLSATPYGAITPVMVGGSAMPAADAVAALGAAQREVARLRGEAHRLRRVVDDEPAAAEQETRADAVRARAADLARGLRGALAHGAGVSATAITAPLHGVAGAAAEVGAPFRDALAEQAVAVEDAIVEGAGGVPHHAPAPTDHADGPDAEPEPDAEPADAEPEPDAEPADAEPADAEPEADEPEPADEAANEAEREPDPADEPELEDGDGYEDRAPEPEAEPEPVDDRAPEPADDQRRDAPDRPEPQAPQRHNEPTADRSEPEPQRQAAPQRGASGTPTWSPTTGASPNDGGTSPFSWAGIAALLAAWRARDADPDAEPDPEQDAAREWARELSDDDLTALLADASAQGDWDESEADADAEPEPIHAEPEPAPIDPEQVPTPLVTGDGTA